MWRQGECRRITVESTYVGSIIMTEKTFPLCQTRVGFDRSRVKQGEACLSHISEISGNSSGRFRSGNTIAQSSHATYLLPQYKTVTFWIASSAARTTDHLILWRRTNPVEEKYTQVRHEVRTLAKLETLGIRLTFEYLTA